MRKIEISLLTINALALLVFLGIRGRVPFVASHLLPPLAVVVALTQLAIEGYRWQMVPAYLVSAGSLFSMAMGGSGLIGPWSFMISVGLELSSLALGTVFPVFALPKPTGPFPIGTKTHHLTDRSRVETCGMPGEQPRELMIQIWYPADQRGPGVPYRSRSQTTLKTEQLTRVITHASAGVPLSRSSDRYPVVLYSGAWTGRRNHNLVQVEELASHGFVVVGIDHPYGSASTAFPDGRVVRAAVGDFLEGSTVEDVERSYSTVIRQLEIRSADARFVLDEIERLDKLDASGLLAGRLDTSRVGIFGYSFGGAVAAESCRQDGRFLAGADLDGNIFGEASSHGVEKPFLFVYGGLTMPPSASGSVPALARESCQNGDDMRRYVDNEDLRNVLRSLEEHGGYRLVLLGATHVHFCDSTLYSPLVARRQPGLIDPARARVLINDSLVRFFTQHLISPDLEPLSGLATYPDAQLDSWPRRLPAAHEALGIPRRTSSRA
jgi:predicted dienelactone hydrolase